MKEKYSKITFKIIALIPLIFIFFGVDQFLLPQKQIKDIITEYSKIEVRRRSKFGSGTSKEFLAYKYYTKKGYEFAVNKSYIEENDIVLNQSYIFKNINKIVTKSRNYSDELTSGLNGACLYLAFGMIFTAITSLILLKFYSNLTENGFLNIVLSNAFLTIIFLYLLLIYNWLPTTRNLIKKDQWNA